MIKLVEFKNFKALRDTKLPLTPFTLLVGPNGSGKSTALEGIKRAADHPTTHDVSVGAVERKVSIKVRWGEPFDGILLCSTLHLDKGRNTREYIPNCAEILDELDHQLAKMRVFSLEPEPIAAPVVLQQSMELLENGGNLAGVLDRLRDQVPERFHALNDELSR